jgi:CheY-like chemotaxis protein
MRSRAVGVPLESHIDDGTLRVVRLETAAITPGEFAERVRASVVDDQARVVVIDSLTGSFNAMTDLSMLPVQMHELLTFLSRNGVLTILIIARAGIMSVGSVASVDVSWLSDSILVFQQFEEEGTVRRCISAIKKRQGELHGGTLRADSPGEGRGAVFTVQLPLPPLSARPLEGLRVLLVEDDADPREAMTQTLRLCGAEVEAVETGDDALQRFAVGTRPHVLLSDLGLPGMDGYALLRQIRARERTRQEPSVPAAMITGYAGVDREQAREAGFSAEVHKPIEPEQLVAVVQQLARTAGGRG